MTRNPDARGALSAKSAPRTTRALLTVGLVATLSALGCATRRAAPEPAASSANEATTRTESEQAAPVPESDARDDGTGATDDGIPGPPIGGMTWTMPGGWEAHPPGNPMRFVEYHVAQREGVAVVAVHYFPLMPESFEANRDRWRGEFTTIDEDTERETLGRHRGVERLTLDIRGTLGDQHMAPGSPSPSPSADGVRARMLTALVRGPVGAVAFKAMGPEPAMEELAPTFEALTESIRRAGIGNGGQP